MNIEQTITHASPEKWTEIELLPEWDEEFYDVYTAKKFGKWHMLKTLKAQYKDDPEYQSMIRKEFDVRYNLTHPNIVIITDLKMCRVLDCQLSPMTFMGIRCEN